MSLDAPPASRRRPPDLAAGSYGVSSPRPLRKNPPQPPHVNLINELYACARGSAPLIEITPLAGLVPCQSTSSSGFRRAQGARDLSQIPIYVASPVDRDVSRPLVSPWSDWLAVRTLHIYALDFADFQ